MTAIRSLLLALLAGCGGLDSLVETGKALREKHGTFLANSDHFSPSVRVAVVGQAPTGVDSEPGEFDLFGAGFDGVVPVPLDEDSVFLAGVGLGGRRYETSSAFPVPSETLYRAELVLGYARFVNDDWFVAGQFTPGLYTDGDGSLGSDDWQFLGAALATWRHSDDVYYKFGVAVDEVFDDVGVFPLLGVAARIDEAWPRLDILLPTELQLTRAFSDGEWLGYLRVDLDGAEYAVRDRAVGVGVVDEIQIQELRVGLGVDWLATGSASLGLFGGAIVAGDHDFKTPLGDRADGQLDPTPFAEAYVGFSF